MAIALGIVAFSWASPARAQSCAERLPQLRELAESRPDDGRVAAQLGSCLFSVEDYTAAADALGRAWDLGERSPQLGLRRIAALYHAGESALARRLLERGDAEGADEAQEDLYRGMIDLDRGQLRDAALQLDRSRRTDPGQVEPVASFHAALAWEQLGDVERAREAYARVASDWDGTAWGDRAREGLARLDEGPATPRPELWLDFGLEHDSNVVLKGTDVTLPSEIADEDDGRASWHLRATMPLLQANPWSVGGRIEYAGWSHRDLDDFDVHSPVLGLRARRAGDAWNLELDYAFGFSWVDSRSFLSSHDWSAALQRDFAERGRLELRTTVFTRDFRFGIDDVTAGGGAVGSACPVGVLLCGPVGLNEDRARDRDGRGITLGLDHRLPVAGWWLGWGYEHERFDADGSEYSYQSHRLLASAIGELPYQVQLRLSAAYTYRPYRHPTTFPDPGDLIAGVQYGLDSNSRRESEWWLGLELERSLTQRVSLITRALFIRNRSNAKVYDYRRMILGAHLRIWLGQ